jgi:hypothetical protein
MNIYVMNFLKIQMKTIRTNNFHFVYEFWRPMLGRASLARMGCRTLQAPHARPRFAGRHVRKLFWQMVFI